MAGNNLNRKSRLKNITPSESRTIAGLLNIDNKWEDLAASLTKRNGTRRFDYHMIKALDRASNPGLHILDTLATSNCTLGDLLQKLEDLKLYMAADHIIGSILGETPPDRDDDKSDEILLAVPPTPESTQVIYERQTRGNPAENSIQDHPTLVHKNPHGNEEMQIYSRNPIPQSNTEMKDEIVKEMEEFEAAMASTRLAEERQSDSLDANANFPVNFTSKQGHLREFSWHELSQLTNSFNGMLLEHGGNLIGQGGFAKVFLGKLPNNENIAVKCLFQFNQIEQFKTEIELLGKYHHDNLLPLLGYSNDPNGMCPCIVYEYMRNGSLEDRLACKNNTAALSCSQRVSVALGTARGIDHLHRSENKPLIHRDIKSANILLDHDNVPKLGDFGLARMGPMLNDPAHTHDITKVLIGTKGYMPPEAHDMEVSVKHDIYSYGVVLLELLTGMKAMEVGREEESLVDHINENCDDIVKFLDRKIETWNVSIAKSLHALAEKCLQKYKDNRPFITEVLVQIENWGDC